MHMNEQTVELLQERHVWAPTPEWKLKCTLRMRHFSKTVALHRITRVWVSRRFTPGFSQTESGPGLSGFQTINTKPLHPHQIEKASHSLPVSHAKRLPPKEYRMKRGETSDFMVEKPGKPWEEHQTNRNCGSFYKIPDQYSSPVKVIKNMGSLRNCPA